MEPEITPEQLIRTIRDQLECEMLLGAQWLPFERVNFNAAPATPGNTTTGQPTMARETKKQAPPKKQSATSTQPKKLDKIAKNIAACCECQLNKTRTNCVPGQGNPNARIVFVGEAPGQSEDEQGLPFVGRSGKLLTNIIEAMGLSRDDVFICNILKCRPPNNDNPTPEQIDACSHFLHDQLAVIKPEVIVALGAYAAKTLLKCKTPIGQLRGKFHEYRPTPSSDPIKLAATYHPSYLLRNYTQDARLNVWQDMQDVLKELGMPIPKKKKN